MPHKRIPFSVFSWSLIEAWDAKGLQNLQNLEIAFCDKREGLNGHLSSMQRLPSLMRISLKFSVSIFLKNIESNFSNLSERITKINAGVIKGNALFLAMQSILLDGNF